MTLPALLAAFPGATHVTLPIPAPLDPSHPTTRTPIPFTIWGPFRGDLRVKLGVRGHHTPRRSRRPIPPLGWLIVQHPQALTYFRPDLHPRIFDGCGFVSKGRVVFVAHRPALNPSVDLFCDMIEGKAPPAAMIATMCQVFGCGRWGDRWDPEGVPFCDRHWTRRPRTWTDKKAKIREARKKKQKAKRKAEGGGLVGSDTRSQP